MTAIRVARADEVERLGEVGFRAFRFGDQAGWTRYYRENTHLGPEGTLVAFAGGVLAGQASSLSLQVSLAGAEVPVAGIAAVAVVPELRRRGVADALVREWLVRLRRRRVGLSLLYPFRASFYRKFGYEVVEWTEHLTLRPDHLPAPPRPGLVRRLEPGRDLPLLRRLYQRWRAGRTGPLARSDYWWRVRVLERFTDGVVWMEPGTGRPGGYLLYDLPPPQRPVGRQRLLVRELVHVSPDAHRGLLGFLRGMGEQLEAVELTVAPGLGGPLAGGYPTTPALAGFDRYHEKGTLGAGAMARLVHLEAALALHPRLASGAVRGTLGLDLEDPLFPAQSGGFDLRLGPGGPRLARSRRARDRVRLDIARLAQLYFAGARAHQLLDAGLIGGSARAARLLDEAFQGPPCVLGPLNAF